VGEHLPVQGVGLGVGVGVGPDWAQYLPPVLVPVSTAICPPQTSISLPVHTAAGTVLAAGTLLVLVALQLFVVGSYLPPVLKKLLPLYPPHTIISVPVQTIV